jgi:uncharacterized protein YcgI (DUF1989 family)
MRPYEMPGGASRTLALPRDHQLTLTALGDHPCVSTLVYAVDPLERLCVPDTLKAQMSACVRPPMVLMSDLGRALCSVTRSTVDWHDAITGHSRDVDVARFGPSSYGTDRNDWRRSARALFLDELATLGLSRRDLHATVNWFVKVVPEERLRFVAGHARTGDSVALRAEQDITLVLATAPHPLDPSPAWNPSPVRLEVSTVDAASSDDPSWTFRAESARALEAVTLR